MRQREGIILQFSAYSQQELLRIIDGSDNYPSFSDALNIANWSYNSREVAVLSFSSRTIDYICIATKKNKVVTAKDRFEFVDFISLESISLRDIMKIIDFDINKEIIKVPNDFGEKCL